MRSHHSIGRNRHGLPASGARWQPPLQSDAIRQNRRRRLLTSRAAREKPFALEDDPDAKLQRLEAILFLSREPLNTRRLSHYASLADGTEARTLIRRINEAYDRTACAFRAEEVAGGFQLMTRPALAPWLRRLDHVPAEIRLSAPALETLSVIAYRQPVLRADIEAIRGVNCGEIIRQLMERDLVRIGGRSDDLGRPYLYQTTKRFLQLFGLTSIEALPAVASSLVAAPVESSHESPEENSQSPSSQTDEVPDPIQPDPASSHAEGIEP